MSVMVFETVGLAESSRILVFEIVQLAECEHVRQVQRCVWNCPAGRIVCSPLR